MVERRRPAGLELAGFRVNFDWTVLVLLALIAWSLATGFLPFGWPGHSGTTYWLVALAAAGLFLGSLVAHELSHAITARRAAGVEVEEISFALFGGSRASATSCPPRGCSCWLPGSGR